MYYDYTVTYNSLQTVSCDCDHNPVSALQVEYGEMPLGLRRRELQLQYAVKLRSNPDNPTRSIMADCWQNKIKYPKEKEPFMVKIKNFEQIIETTGEILRDNEYPTQPPWVAESTLGTNSVEGDTNEASRTRNHVSSCEMNDFSNQTMDGKLNQFRNEDAKENTIYATNTKINGTDLMDIPQ